MKTASGWRYGVGCGVVLFAMAAPCALGQAGAAQAGGVTQAAAGLDWDQTFLDRSGTAPVHFVATYTDAHGKHRLEEWRVGLSHVRRRTDDRIDLHADAVGQTKPGQGAEYLWQIVDLKKKIDNQISSGLMFQAGLFYSYYSMAHVLTRPAGKVRVSAVAGEPVRQLLGETCSWYEIAPDAQAPARVCWAERLGIPLETRSLASGGVWTTSFVLESVDRKPLAPSIFVVNRAGLTVHNHDQMVDVD